VILRAKPPGDARLGDARLGDARLWEMHAYQSAQDKQVLFLIVSRQQIVVGGSR
jgi:hypothetical protein